MKVTQGQLDFELAHLKMKLRRRAPHRLKELRNSSLIEAHPVFKVVVGEIESWERVGAFGENGRKTTVGHGSNRLAAKKV